MEIKCDYCGKIFNSKCGKIHFERSKRHYCSRQCLYDSCVTHGLASRIRNGGKQDERYQLWCQAKKRARIKNRYFNLKIEDIPEIPKLCPILGIEIIIGIGKLSDNSPSIDRIDNKLGYIKKNIRIISYRANRIKGNTTIEEIKKILKDMEG